MRAAPGAVEGVKISDDDVLLQVIGDVEPLGLAGSGLVDAVAALVAAGLVDSSGRLIQPDAPGVPAGLAARLQQVGKERVFVLHFRGGDPADSLYLSQRDIRELQFAKAAIATGWTLLLEEQGLTDADVAQVVLAGSFGSYLAPSGAVRIGLVPEVATLRIVSAGNVAGEGAKMALLSDARTGRRPGAAGGGALRRALRPPRFQRPLRRPTRLPLSPSSGSRWWRAGRSPGTSPTSPSAAAGPSTSTRCPRCCTTARSASPPRSSGRVTRLRPRYARVAVGYADCGTYGALDEVCARLEVPQAARRALLRRVRGRRALPALLAAEPGTYVLTDYLVTSFHRSVVVELGLDRYPELRDTYFGHYRRVVWLAQHPTDRLRAAAERAAEQLGLPLETMVVGDALLEEALAELLAGQR